jgi:FKBP-type peptidyl-prolyl cis-trans isomerase
MRAGGTRTIVLPADLAFGAQGQGSIPGDAVVVFEITVSDLVRP